MRRQTVSAMAAAVAVMLLCLMMGQPVAQAEPQANAGLIIGGAAAGTDGGFFDRPEFHLGLRGDVIFGRTNPWSFGVGPYAEVGTFAFDELSVGTGASVHLPIHDSLPFVLSAGPFIRYGDDDFGVEPGISTSLFWGSRSYNFHESYIMAVGISVGYRATFTESKESALVIAAQLDLALLGLPVVALVNLIRGPTGDAALIED
ncbi:MAG: hypothetical protein R3B72_30755 [Polyangiaceae bacterium]